MMMHYGKNYTGNARFYGFCVDILDSVAKQVGFEVSILSRVFSFLFLSNFTFFMVFI